MSIEVSNFVVHENDVFSENNYRRNLLFRWIIHRRNLQPPVKVDDELDINDEFVTKTQSSLQPVATCAWRLQRAVSTNNPLTAAHPLQNDCLITH